MKKTLLLTILFLMVTFFVHSDIVSFDRQFGSAIDDVQGNIYIYNNLLNIWELAPPWQDLTISVKSSQPGIPDKVVDIVTVSLGRYGHTFLWDPGEKDLYDLVEIVFKGGYYYGEFDQFAHVDIWWVQHH